jgi:ornithine cyclodeaminase/alanine dehydrogenase-like protein (mu-crystallin family)
MAISKVLYLSRPDIESIGLDGTEVVEPLRSAFEEMRTDPRTEMPPKPGLHPRHDMMLHASLAFLPKADIAGMKWLSGYPHNPRLHGLPYFSGIYVLNDAENGLPLAIIEATWITETRTAVATALTLMAARPNKDAGDVAILGVGAQGKRHAEIFTKVLPGLHSLRVFDVNQERAAGVAASIPGAVACKSGLEAMDGATCVVSATPTTVPPRHEWDGASLADGSAIVALDFDSAWDPRIFERVSLFVVDNLTQYLYFKTERGTFPGYPDAAAELTQLLAGMVEVPATGLVFCNNLGVGIEDVVMAKVIYDKAREAGVGIELDLF